MRLSRRAVLTSAAVGVAAPALFARPAAAASAPGDVVGKITVGYQGWFACIGDGAPINGWWHWSQDWSRPPSPSNNGTLRAWPDMRDYPRGYQTGYANLGNGSPATLFSHYDQTTVNLHFLWMQQNDIDTAALQRFNPNGSEGPTRDAVTSRVRSAAEAYGRKFYIMYDVTGWTSMRSEIKTDWASKMSTHTASPGYARQKGKPVVGIWGFGFNDANHPWDPATCLDVINWFKAQGCYVMGGVPTHWRDGTSDSRAGYLDVYHAFNMLSPWMVGRIGNAGDSDNFYAAVNVPDQADCNAHGIDYQPCVLPGDVSARQRAHGDFMWRQFYNMVRLGAQGIYISMFDEFNEGNQIVKTAESPAFIPTNAGLLGLDEDGTACSSDYYLRLTGDGGRMLKGQIALTPTRPTQPVVGNGGGSSNLALRKATTASSTNQNYAPGNAVDGDAGSYWESANNAFPQWFQVDLGSAVALGRLVLRLPPTWGARTQTLTVSGSTDGSSFTTLVGSATYTFAPDATITLTATTRYLRLTFTANAGWPAAQLSELEAYAPSTGDSQPPTAPGNLTVTGHTSTSVSLSWSASTDNVGVTGYQVRRDGTVVATVTGTAYTVGGLSPATGYGFTVAARDAAGNVSAPSNAVTATTDPAATTNLARGKATTASSYTQVYAAGNAVDGDTGTYWESANNAFPQWFQVDLGSVTTVGRLVLRLPPSWGARTQTLTVSGSTDGSSFTTLVGSATYTFAPDATITLSATTRYLRLTFTANTGWPAGQLSELEAYQS